LTRFDGLAAAVAPAVGFQINAPFDQDNILLTVIIMRIHG
jgi:hypothetical protein